METPAAESYELQDRLYHLLLDTREWRRYLAEMVDWEQSHPPQNEWDGWEWTDVHTPPSIINSLITMGVVDVRSKSRTYTHYRLRSVSDTQEALVMLVSVQPESPRVDVDGLFKLVIGHERAKALLTYAIRADSAVHCLLTGPIGCAKTLMLSDVGRLSGGEFYVGSTTTKSGLVGMLIQSRPRFLVIDELDKMDDRDMTPLLNLMETGMVTRLQHRVQERITLDTKVFAGANDLRRISAPILSRFAKVEIPPYTPAEFVEVARGVLVQREDQGPEMAQHIASEVVKHSTDIRDAVRVARMARKDPMRVLEIIRCLWPKPRPGTVTQLQSRR